MYNHIDCDASTEKRTASTKPGVKEFAVATVLVIFAQRGEGGYPTLFRGGEVVVNKYWGVGYP